MPKSDGTSARTRRRLIEDAGFKASDFLVDDAPANDAGPARANTPSGDPTRKMNQQDYDAEKARKKAEMDKKYLEWKTKMRGK
jgi:hypothetical protein